MTQRGASPNIFTIPAGVPFLPALVCAIGQGQLIAGIPDEGDPFAWTDLTIYLPTRRAARAVRQVIVDSTDGAAIFPRIFPLGDLDETDTIFDPGEGPAETREPALLPAISPVRRQFLLARLVTQWSRATAAASLAGEELDTEPSAFPASPADAARLAADLAVLLDQATAEGGAWSDLDAAIASDHAEHWNLTGDFLKIIRSAWPAIKSQFGVLDPGERRDALIRRQAARFTQNGAPKPVIAAGSTGTSPATAELLAAIANLENGALVLPGLDQQMHEAAWEAIDSGSEHGAGATARKSGAKDRRMRGNDAAAGHPQYGLKQLLRTLQVSRANVVELAQATPLMAARANLLSGALSPPKTVSTGEEPAPADGGAVADEKPVGAAEHADKSVANIGLIEAATEREEASAIALILRHTVENPDKIAALITPDRALACRVSVELQRWDISVDDSAGTPLLSSSPAVQAILTARIGYRIRDPHDMLALCQSAIALPGLDPGESCRAAGALERIAFRGRALPAGRTALQDRLAAQSNAFGPRAAERENDRATPRAHTPQALRGLGEKDWQLASTLAESLDRALVPMEECAGDGSVPVSFRTLLAAHSETIACLDVGQPDNSPLDDSRRAMDAAMAELLDDAGEAPDILPVQYPDFLTAMLANRVVRATHIRDTRIHIWGTLEARLQHVDVAILAGLNETIWPAQTRLDPFLSRGMRTALALHPPERRIGLAAHDFTQGMGHGEIWLTRAGRRGSTPQVASRWLQRFVAAAGENAEKAMSARGAYYLGIARSLDCSPAPAQSAKRPQPAPGVALRPRRLSVTEIETLIRDPYTIFARHVLKLRPMEPVAVGPDMRDRGTLLHDILHAFVAERPAGPFDGDANARLMEIGRDYFRQFADEPIVQTLWWPRFEAIARWFLETEQKRDDIVDRLPERSGRLELPSGFLLTVRADRIDRLNDGRLGIIDYKTGAPPTNKQVLSLVAPQLPIEAVIAAAGGFDGIEAAQAARLEYYRLGGRAADRTIKTCGTRKANDKKEIKEVSLQETIDAALARLTGLIAVFDDPRHPYIAQRIPAPLRGFAGDYDHLARIAEWSVEDGE